MNSLTSTSAPRPDAELAPVGSGERLVLLDALRGFAVCGILFANIGYFSGYDYLSAAARAAFASAHLDHTVEFLEHIFIEGKFYSLFSLLFGLGFATQLQRAQDAGRSGSALFRRRLFGLLLIGLAHSYLLWLGDILSIYALVGFALMPFWRRSDRTVLTWAAGLLALPVLQYALMLMLLGGNAHGGASVDATQSQFDRLVAGFGTGSYTETVANNARAMIVGRYPNMLFTGRLPTVLGMFLIGLYVGRRRLLADAGRQRALLARVAGWGIGLGLIGNIAYAVLLETDSYYGLRTLGLVQSAIYALAVPMLCLGYAAGFALLFQIDAWRRRLLMFAPLGRVALSAYLGQTIICLLIFYGYGFGLYFHVGRARGLLIALAICAVQALLARPWLARMRFGPAEWAWRSFTYARWQPWRAVNRVAAPTDAVLQ